MVKDLRSLVHANMEAEAEIFAAALAADAILPERFRLRSRDEAAEVRSGPPRARYM